MIGQTQKQGSIERFPVRVISILGLMFFLSVAAKPSKSQQLQVGRPTVPADFRSFISPDDRVLAYKTLQAPGNGNVIAVVITRRNDSVSVNDQVNPCQMIIFLRKQGVVSVKDKSSSIVDCQSNDLARRSMDLNKNLELSSKEITYIDPQIRGNDRYTFRYSFKEKTWYLYKVVFIYAVPDLKEKSMKSVKETATYPKNLRWMTLANFDLTEVARHIVNSRVLGR